MELSPEEQSFFEAGDAIDDGPPAAGSQPRPEGHHHHRTRRRSRRRITRRLRRQLRRSGWGKTVVAVLLTVVAVGAGYWASMYVLNRDLPSPAELGVEARGH
jgi:hypothetical protein